MYEERKNSMSFKDVILQLMLVVLFVLIMIWLFPTKNYLKDNFVGKEELESELSLQLQSLYGRLFTDNIESMRDAAQGYFTNERLPQKIGDSATLTLKEMEEKKLVIPFKDSNNQSCDVTNSYVKITKMDDEYQMKVQLTCSDYSDYIIVYMGCYDYCDSDLCIKEETPTTPSKPVEPEKPTAPETPVVNKKYKYEYRLDIQNTYSAWGPWSEWSKVKVTPNELRQVEMDTFNELVGYRTEIYYEYVTSIEYKEQTIKVQVGTENRPVGDKVVDTKPAIGDTKTEKVYGNVIKKTTSGGYSDWVYQGYTTKPYQLFDTDTIDYQYVSHKTVPVCDDVCKNVTYYTYKVYKRTYTEGTTTYSCPTGYTKEGSGASTKCYKYVTTGTGTYSCSTYGSDYKLDGANCIKTETIYKEVPIYKEVTTTIPVEVVEKVERTKNIPIYEEVKYYRYRTREQLTVAGYDIKWSTSKNDQYLLSLGYYLTGKKEEV